MWQGTFFLPEILHRRHTWAFEGSAVRRSEYRKSTKQEAAAWGVASGARTRGSTESRMPLLLRARQCSHRSRSTALQR
jgi:hypothetical protein